MNGDADLFLLADSGGVTEERWPGGCCLREKNSSRGVRLQDRWGRLVG